MIAGRRIEARDALHDVPSVIHAATVSSDNVHLFEAGLSDVGDEEQTAGQIEGKAPWIAEAVCPDLSARPLLADEWVVGRNRVRITTVDVDSQNLPEESASILAIPQRVSGVAAIAQADVEHTVGPEEIQAAFVIREWLRDGQDEFRRSQPPCSTTKSRESPAGAVTKSGFDNPPTTSVTERLNSGGTTIGPAGGSEPQALRAAAMKSVVSWMRTSRVSARHRPGEPAQRATEELKWSYFPRLNRRTSPLNGS